MSDSFKRRTRAITGFIHANGGKTIGEEDAERRRAKYAASAIEARSGETPKSGSTEGESAAPEGGDAQ